MEFIYLSAGFTIYPHRHLIQKNAEAIQVRPKTFALLLLLLENPRDVLAKQFLLDKIWDDVTVDEPVLVQSIREIRQLFGSADVIQTYPRKGYAWIAEVQKHTVDPQTSNPPVRDEELSSAANRQNALESLTSAMTTSAATMSTSLPTSAKASFFNQKNTLVIVAIFVSMLLVAYGLYSSRHEQSQYSESQTQVVIVLPVKNTIPGNDHNWVNLGAMDQLIGSLTSSHQVQVMNVDYVLDLMQIGKIPKNYTSEEADRVFNVSGATLVVESQLSGSVAEYELVYRLHFRNDLKRGVILEKNINEALHKLSLVIASYTGQTLNSTLASQNAFINELLARSIEKFNAQDFEAARAFLITLKQLEPNDLTVRELLVKTLFKLRDASARDEVQSAFELAKTQGQPEPAALHTELAMSELREGHNENALAQLTMADQLANQEANILYQAYNAQMRGYIFQQQHNYSHAQASYEAALKFHSMIRCPIGMATTHIDMAKLFAAQAKLAQAKEQLAQAKALIATHKLDSLTAMLDLNLAEQK